MLFPKYIWEMPDREKKIYLTFDDGPTPEITAWTLAQLRQYNAKATFFCIGDNIEKYPDIFKKLIAEGHSIGNHTFNHLNGWKTQTQNYLENTKKCDDSISKLTTDHCRLFRPPYGKIKKSQAKILLEQGYKIIMWDVLSADFDTEITAEKCLENVLSNIKPGSIIIFHDSIKAFKNLEYTLPKTLAFLKENGYNCEAVR
jgi:peptidoglycan/xylan/chitin deacetylase (PgdA/CDA1 family)